MELRVLRYFLEVAREGNITAAAENLHITQPTLSKQLMELEDELGKKLFIRGKRRITLTEDGVLLRKRAGEIIDLVQKTESELKNTDDVVFGDIYFGAGETDGMKLVAKVCKNLQERFPHIRYHLYSGNSEDVIEKLDKGLIDFGVLIEPSNIKKYNYIKLPSYNTWGVLTRKDNPLARLQYVTSENLLDIPLICSKQALDNNELAGWLGYNVEKLNIVATYNLIYNASFFVEEGVGSALTLDNLVNITNDSKLCFIPLKPRLRTNLVMCWKKSQVFSKVAQIFLEELQKQI